MSKRHKNKQRKKTRKKRHHTHDASLPRIKPNPTYHSKDLNRLPKIMVTCDEKISRSAIKKLRRRLNFVDHRDLRGLSCICIVNPSAFSRGECTSGCYHRRWKGRKPEIWLSSRLFRSPGRLFSIFSWFSGIEKDWMLETLFHEIGHHKGANLYRKISSYKNEAYAEKYMQAYKDAWFKKRIFSRIVHKIFGSIFNCIPEFIIKYITAGIFYFYKNKSPMYNLLYQESSGQITKEEFMQPMETMERNNQPKKKKRWVHPLNKDEYREKFNIEDRF